MQIKQNLVKSSKYGVKCPNKMNPEYVTFHNTDNNAPAKNEINYMINNDREVSFHVAVDDIEAIQGIPFDRNAWHCGDGNSTGNRKSIGVEICYNTLGANNPKFRKSEDNAVIVCSQLLKQFGLGIDRLKPHKYWSGKNCPSTTNHANFIARVKLELEKGNNQTLPAAGSRVKFIGTHWATGQQVSNWVIGSEFTISKLDGDRALLKEAESWAWIKDLSIVGGIQIGSKVKVIGDKYTTGQAIPTWVKKEVYTIQQIKDTKALLKEIESWVYIRDLNLA